MNDTAKYKCPKCGGIDEVPAAYTDCNCGECLMTRSRIVAMTRLPDPPPTFVYVVLAGYDHDTTDVRNVTTDRADAEAKAMALKGRYDFATVERWDALADKCDTGYEFELR